MEQTKYWHGDQPWEHESYDVRRIDERSAIEFSTGKRAEEQTTNDEGDLRKSTAEYEVPQAELASEQKMASPWFKTSKLPLGMMTFLLTICILVVPTSAVLLKFDNCLSNEYLNKHPPLLQFVPKFLDAVFDTSNSDHNLNITIWGNVTGTGPEKLLLLPLPENSYWSSNQSNLGGKIVNQPDETYNVATTLFNKINVLTYQPWEENDNFCERMLNQPCPIAPVFKDNAYVSSPKSIE